MARIRRVDCSGPGIRRRRRGRSFSYEAPTGEPITDTEVLARIRGLGIPPAWKDVWICPSPTGHLQAVGTDAAGRRQYLYHEAWRTRRDQADRETARSFLPFLGGDDPGAATDVPRSRVEQGPPPTYGLSDERNTP